MPRLLPAALLPAALLPAALLSAVAVLAAGAAGAAVEAAGAGGPAAAPAAAHRGAPAGWLKPVPRSVRQVERSLWPRPAEWLAGMDYAARLDLDTRMATQALLDDALTVLGQQGSWYRVQVDGQTGSVYPHGVVGWVPASQVSLQPPSVRLPGRPQEPSVTVSVDRAGAGPLVLSYGTTMPVLSSGAGKVTVATPRGAVTVDGADVRSGALPPSGPAVVAEAERFLGLPYLWAGTSSYGFDCSGLTYMVYRQFGIALPRDAADQAAAGRPVPATALQPGDLVFYAFGGSIDHVGIYAGQGRMLDAPETGASVELVPMWGTPLAAHFAGAARYLPASAA